MILFKRFSLKEHSEAKAFIKTRDMIGKVFMVAVLAIYMYMWTIYKPEDTPTFSHYFTLIFTPLLLFGLTMRVYHYLFLYNWFYILYCVTTGFLFFHTMSYFHPTYMGGGYGMFELGHLLAANLIGLVIAIAVSLPFKLVHGALFEPSDMYYDTDILAHIDNEIYPEKKAKEVEKQKQKFVFDSMNETQLQAELQVALKEERFEDAEQIKKILDNKFK